MCKFKLFSIAAAALMMVACSNEDLTQQTQTKAGKMQFSATIAAPSSGATTRTIYTEDTQNKKITVAWKVDDKIALVHNGVKDVATVKTINSDGSATITGYVTGATNNADVRLVYPAARVGTVTGGADGTEYTADETVEGKLKTQGGTLAYIQDNLDYREDMGQLAVSETGVTLAEKAGDISPLLAIWKLTLSDGTNNLSATQVKIKGGESVLASTTTLATATSVVTLAIPNVAIDGALTIEATVGSDTYTYTKAEGPTFNPRTYYQSTVTMAKAAAYLAWDNTKKELVATLIPENATAVTNAEANVNWSAGTYVVEGDVKINGDIELKGDVNLIIKDGAKLTVNGYINGNINLSIYGQANQTGQLVVNSTEDAISNINTLEVHSCQVTATSSSGSCGGFFNIGTFNVYGGSVDAEYTGSSAGYGISLKEAGALNIYGGEVKAVGKGSRSDYSHGIMGDGATITVYGGKLWAGSAGERALYNITLNKGAGFTGKIQTSGNNENWNDWNWEFGTPSDHYVKVE